MPTYPLLAGRYRLGSQIAAGGVGEVWRAEDTVLGRLVAVKLLRAEFAEHAETLARFRAEARHAGALSHPAIARVFDYGEPVSPYPPFLVMELVDGPSLSAVLAAGPLDAAQTLDVVAQVASGLQAAHAAALVHRDIKPANLLLAADGQVKITDFGIAHVAGSAPVTRTGTVVGTPAYLAPERVSGASATPASDLYSLGVVAYHCLAGAPPFAGKPVEVAVAHRDLPLPPFPFAVPAEVALLVAGLTAKDPSARPAGAQEVASWADRLREDMIGGMDGAGSSWVHAIPATAAKTPAPEPAPPLSPTLQWQQGQPIRRHRRMAATAAGAAAAVVVLALLSLVVARGLSGRPTSSASQPGRHISTQPSPSATRSPSPPATVPPPGTVEVTAGSLVGQPLGLVRQRLRVLGLDVRVQQRPSDQETGTVLAVQPSGQVRPASTIVVIVAFTPPPQDGGHHHHHHHHRNGNGQTVPAVGTLTNAAARRDG
jgi:eukaryotic-like serine/threonine-protein kinase